MRLLTEGKSNDIGLKRISRCNLDMVKTRNKNTISVTKNPYEDGGNSRFKNKSLINFGSCNSCLYKKKNLRNHANIESASDKYRSTDDCQRNNVVKKLKFGNLNFGGKNKKICEKEELKTASQGSYINLVFPYLKPILSKIKVSGKIPINNDLNNNKEIFEIKLDERKIYNARHDGFNKLLTISKKFEFFNKKKFVLKNGKSSSLYLKMIKKENNNKVMTMEEIYENICTK